MPELGAVALMLLLRVCHALTIMVSISNDAKYLNLTEEYLIVIPR